MDVPAGVTQEEGNTGFSIHLLSAVLVLIFLARRIQPFQCRIISLVAWYIAKNIKHMVIYGAASGQDSWGLAA